MAALHSSRRTSVLSSTMRLAPGLVLAALRGERVLPQMTQLVSEFHPEHVGLPERCCLLGIASRHIR